MTKPKKRQKTAEQIRQQKRDCERKRRARIKNNPALYEAAKEKDRARYAEKKRKKQIKLVSEMTPREHRQQLKEWRERKARSRLKQKRNKILNNHLRENTPATTDDEVSLPRSPAPLGNNDVVVASRLASPTGGSSCAGASSTCSRSLRSTPQIMSGNSRASSECSTSSRQKRQGVLLSRKKRDSSNLMIKKQKETIQNMKRKIHALQVKLLRAAELNRSLKRCLPNKKGVIKLTDKNTLRKTIKKFLERDDNSKICPGKKDLISKHKMKMQKRYLSDTMLNLYKKFLSEKNPKVSLATFCRWRPFWIVARQISERDTCLCVVHENMQLMFDKLKFLDIISDLNLVELCKTLVCDINSYECMLRKCEICKTKVPKIKDFDNSTETTYKLWTVKKEKRIIHGKEKEIRRTVKTEEKITKKTLLLKFLEALDVFLQHIYNIRHQYVATTSLKNNLSVGEIFMQVDFAENYCCKYSDEIQAVHFGASRQQISLHTGVYYFKCLDTDELKNNSFCTISDCLRHDASAIFAHIKKIIQQICLSHPHSLRTLHVLSDGPTAQYRNKKAFYLFSQFLTQRYGIKVATWNFNEAGHGKGPMDGVGAVVKRTADRIVAQGNDIPDLLTFVKFVETSISNVAISLVTEADIEDIDKMLTDKVKNIPGTLKIHQVTWNATNPKRLYLRKLTCVTCEPGVMCPHYSLPKGFVDYANSACLADIPGPSVEQPISCREDDVQANTNGNLCPITDENVSGSMTDENSVPCDADATSEAKNNETSYSGPIYKEGMWIVVRFLTKRTEKHFLGQIIGFEGPEPKVKFTKKNKVTKDHFIFVWIDPDDIFPVPREDIMAVLTEPTPGRRGELQFSIKDLTHYKNIQ